MLFDLLYPKKLYNEISMFFFKTNFSKKVTIAEFVTLLLLTISIVLFYIDSKIGVALLTITIIGFVVYLKALDNKMSNILRELYEQYPSLLETIISYRNLNTFELIRKLSESNIYPYNKIFKYIVSRGEKNIFRMVDDVERKLEELTILKKILQQIKNKYIHGIDIAEALEILASSFEKEYITKIKIQSKVSSPLMILNVVPIAMAVIAVILLYLVKVFASMQGKDTAIVFVMHNIFFFSIIVISMSVSFARMIAEEEKKGALNSIILATIASALFYIIGLKIVIG